MDNSNGPQVYLNLSGVSEYKKAVICLMERIGILDKLHSHMSNSATGCEFNINESII